MKTLALVAMLVAITFGSLAMQALADNNPANNPPNPAAPNTVQNPAPGQIGGPQGPAGFVPVPQVNWVEINKVNVLMNQLKELNMQPDFTLTADQKQQIADVVAAWTDATKADVTLKADSYIAKINAVLTPDQQKVKAASPLGRRQPAPGGAVDRDRP